MGKKSTLSQQYSVFSFDSEEQLPSVFEPSKQSIQNILNYSKALQVKKSKYIDHIETIKN